VLLVLLVSLLRLCWCYRSDAALLVCCDGAVVVSVVVAWCVCCCLSIVCCCWLHGVGVVRVTLMLIHGCDVLCACK